MPVLMAILAWFLMALLVTAVLRSRLQSASIFSIARTLLAEGWRRGVLPVGGAILFIGLALLPLLVEDASEASARLQIVLDYGQLWIATVVILLTLLMACGSLCDEIVTGRMRFLVVQPGSRWSVLPGKWLGLVAASFTLLFPATLMLVLISGQVSSSNTVLMESPAVSLVQPEQLQVTPEKIEQYLAFQKLEDPAGWGRLDHQEAIRIAYSRLNRLSRSVMRGGRSDYRFSYSTGLSKGTELAIRPSMGRAHRSQRARMRVHMGASSQEILIRNGMRSRVPLPEALEGEREIVIGIEFLGAVDEDVRIPSVNWSGTDSIQLRVPDGSHLSTLIRSQLLLWIRCAFIAALGLTVSTFLGLPVATLFVFCFLIAAAGGGFSGAFEESKDAVHHDHGHDAPSRIVLDTLAEGGDWIVSQLATWNQHVTGGRVAAGEVVTNSEVLSGLARIGLLWAGVTMLTGLWINSRREHGLGADR